ncbi:MAG: GAF domain-containing SpoIIE family protein phosphatase [Candidatus Zixiibacteriota bacterium]
MAFDLQQQEIQEELETKLEATRAQLHDLATMGAVVTAIQEIDSVLSVVTDMAIRLIDGEVGLMMISENGELHMKISWGVSEEFVRTLMYADDQDLATYCFTHQEAVILSDLGIKSDEGLSIDSVIAMPIRTSRQCLGVLIVFNKVQGGNYTEDDREVLEMLMNFAAVALDNSILIKDKLDRQKIEQEMAIAKQVQETILPKDTIHINGVEVGAIYFPARDVSGDFWDIVRLDDSRFMVIIGDVSNKGVPAALVMSASSGIIKSLISGDPTISVSALATRLNELLAREIIKEREMFVTLFFCKFDLTKKEVTFCNAGHLPGLFWDETEQTVESLNVGGPIVGQFETAVFKEGSRTFGSGDRLFLFTDGLTEAMDAQGQLFGRERVEQVFTSEIDLNPKEFCLRVKDWVDRFSKGAPEDSQDDFTILQVRME